MNSMYSQISRVSFSLEEWLVQFGPIIHSPSGPSVAGGLPCGALRLRGCVEMPREAVDIMAPSAQLT